MLFSLAACSNVDSFLGKIEGIEENKLIVDCSNTVFRDESGDINAVGYNCLIQVDDNLLVVDLDGGQEDGNFLKRNQVVEVILDKPKNIGTSLSSRVVVAKELIVLSEE